MNRQLSAIGYLLLAATLTACSTAAPPTPAASMTAATPGLGFNPAELDHTIRPQDDLWGFVNGKWVTSTAIPADWSSYGTFQIIAEKTEAQLRELIETAARQPAEPGSEQQKIGALYLSFMDEARIEALGVRPLDPELAAINALRTHAEVIAWFGTALATGIQAPVQLYVDADATDPTRNLAYFWQDGLGLPDRDYYLDDRAELKDARQAYAAHIAKLFGLAGWPHGQAAATTIIGIERKLAERQWSSVQNRDDEKIYRNQVDLATAASRSPGFDWPAFLAAARLRPPGHFVLSQMDYFMALGQLVRSVPVADWQTWLRFKTLKHYAPFLNAAIVAEDFAFEGGTLQGKTANKARWKRGVQFVSRELGDAVGKTYVARQFPPSSRQRINLLIDNLREAYHESIDSLAWMTPETKQAAQAKLARISSKIGYPDRWRDFSAVTIVADDLAGNVRRTLAFAHDYEAAKLGKPVDRSEWLTTPQIVNAYYQPTANEITFPAAILQPPFFDPAADDAFNYGSIGGVIGHELSHAFDDQGRKFDGDGRLRDWWTAADAEQYTVRTKKLVTQFDSFRPLPNFSVNGQLTLGENIADLAGLVIAHRAWQHSLHGKAAPVIGDFTGEQRFFIGYAVSERGKTRPERLQSLLLSDPHSPDEYRVTGVVQNMPEFYAAFGVKSGDKLFLQPEERVGIW